MPAMPRKTLVACVSLPSLTMAELMQCSVVVYLLSDCWAPSKLIEPAAGRKGVEREVVPMYSVTTAAGQQSMIIVLRRKGDSEPSPRSTALYLTNIGPV